MSKNKNQIIITHYGQLSIRTDWNSIKIAEVSSKFHSGIWGNDPI